MTTIMRSNKQLQVVPSGPGRFFCCFSFERKGLLPQHRPEKMMKIERNNGIHPKTLFEIAMALLTIRFSFP